MIRHWRFSLACLLPLVSGALGYFLPLEDIRIIGRGREPSSESAATAAYAELPCATEAEYLELTREVKFSAALSGEHCDDSFKARFGKLLKFAKTLGAPARGRWQGGSAEAIESPFRYIGGSNRKIGLDFEQAESIAYNENEGDVSLGKLFFSEEPLEAILTLIHESRHSSSSDPGHTRCKAGDLAQADGACDLQFQIDDRAGAYAFHVSFALGLTRLQSNLSESDREFLLTTALETLGTRFNIVPEFLAHPFETLVILTKANRLYHVHPLTWEAVPLKTQPSFKPTTLRFDRKSNGLLAVSDEGLMMTASPLRPFAQFGKLSAPDARVLDFEHLTYLREPETISHTYFLDRGHRIWLIEFDPEQTKLVTKLSDFQDAAHPIRRLIHADTDSRYALGEDGKLRYFDSLAAQARISLSSYQDPDGRGWRDIHGGFLHEDLYAVSENGTLYYLQDETMKRSAFQVPESRLYLESASFRVQMDRENRVFLRRHTNRAQVEVPSPDPDSPLANVAFIRRFVPHRRFETPESADADFVARCRTTVQASNDPWIGTGLGVTENGQLMVKGPGNACTPVTLPGLASGYRFVGTETTQDGKFSTVALQVTLRDGSVVELLPYVK